MLNIWWVWLTAALLLAILELLAPTSIFLGFAMGAAVVGGLLGLGLSVSWPWLLVIFAVASLLGWIALRAVLGIRKGQVKVWKRDINED